jgi:hypothetical protein
MSEESAAPIKVCAICGADVKSRPRVKDAQGRYFCRECAARIRAELADKVRDSVTQPVIPSDEDADIMARLVEESLTRSAEVCPSCRRPWTEGAVVCTGCGYKKEADPRP